jgi:hypothetical protein
MDAMFTGRTNKTFNSDVKNVYFGYGKLESDHSRGCKCLNWGYHGHGSLYLAEALMINLGYSKSFAMSKKSVVCQNLIAGLPDNWQMTKEQMAKEIKNAITQG